MVFNRFTFNIVLRLGLILVNLTGISYVYERGDLFYTLMFLGVIMIGQIISLVNFVNKTNAELSKFIMALRDTDYTAKFPKAENESFALLYERFQHTLEHYKSKETKYEAQYLFIQELIDNIETGLLALDENDKVVVINRIARQMRADYRYENGNSLISVLEGLADSQIITGENDFGEKVELLVNRSEFKLLDKPQTIFTFKDISSPLETREIESWQKLIRILAHEIINSLTPITSLSDTTLLILRNSKYHHELSDIELSLKTIRERSENLLTFMDDYRKLVKIPQPKPENFDIREKMRSILHLFKAELENIQIEQTYDHKMILADPVLFEQVMVNLVTNCIQAFSHTNKPAISINFSHTNKWMKLTVRDNGSGMDQDTLSRALIPFYTTKETGSGIGLSLVQQIINLHRGKVQIESEVNSYTQITLLFPLDHTVK